MRLEAKVADVAVSGRKLDLKEMPLNSRLTPALILFGAILIAAAGALSVIWVAIHQPWLGVDLKTSSEDGVIVVSTDPTGPNGGIPPGSRIISLASAPDGEKITLIVSDLIEEPDAFGTFEELGRFYARQGRLHTILSHDVVYADIVTPEDHYPDTDIGVWSQRAFVDLPPVFWVQIFVGVTGFLVGAWVWSLRRRDLSAFFFALAGLGLFISALPASVYSTRELALPSSLFTALSNANHAGAMTFGAGMIGLFLNYPRRLVPTLFGAVPAIVLGASVYADMFRLLSGPPVSRQFPIALAMAAILLCIVFQYLATRGDPRGRAALRWLGLSVLIGAGAFVLTVIVPELIGAKPAISQGYAFLFFLLIYVGFALGILRYRLFDLEQWAFRILFYMAGILLIVLLDVVLVFLVSIEQIPAFSLAFVAVALLYLPFRDVLWRRFFTGKSQNRERLFAQIVDITLTPPGKSQSTRWSSLIEELFDPLRIAPSEPAGKTRVEDDGLVLIAPAIAGLPALRIEYLQRGRRLFGPRDVALVEELISMLSHAFESREAYEKGVLEERARIARDMHDNIGAQLLSALHSRQSERKDTMIRESLSDLRNIINNLTEPGLSLDEILADLRAETGERLSSAGMQLDWRIGTSEEAHPLPFHLSHHHAHALRSVIREAVSNVIRHSGATRALVEVFCDKNRINVSIEDDGKSFDVSVQTAGNGLANMQTRLKGLRGTLDILPSASGTRICAEFPVSSSEGP